MPRLPCISEYLPRLYARSAAIRRHTSRGGGGGGRGKHRQLSSQGLKVCEDRQPGCSGAWATPVTHPLGTSLEDRHANYCVLDHRTSKEQVQCFLSIDPGPPRATTGGGLGLPPGQCSGMTTIREKQLLSQVMRDSGGSAAGDLVAEKKVDKIRLVGCLAE